MTFVPAVLAIGPTTSQRRAPVALARVAVMVALAFAITAIGLLLAPAPIDAWSGGQFNSASERQLIALTNQSRAAAGLKALKIDSTLTSVARSRSKDMIVRNYFSHSIPPSGKNVFAVLDSKRYCYKVAGENIGWNNYPDDVATKTIHRQFMASSGHRANIMGKRWDVIGVGAYKSSSGKKMWTVLFADKCGSSGGTTTKPKPNPAPATKAVTKPKATPKPTPKPTPVPTPVRTMTPEPTDLVGLGLGPGDKSNSDGEAGPAEAATAPAVAKGDGVGSLRVVDPATPPGLVETIVGDVTGFFLGG